MDQSGLDLWVVVLVQLSWFLSVGRRTNIMTVKLLVKESPHSRVNWKKLSWDLSLL